VRCCGFGWGVGGWVAGSSGVLSRRCSMRGRYWSFQMTKASSSTRVIWVAVAGWCSSLSSCRRVVKARLAVGSGTGTWVGGVEAVRPWVRAFWAERALPAGVRGPVDLRAFWRFLVAWSVVCGPSSVVVRRVAVLPLASSGGKAMLDMSYPLCKNRGYPNIVRTIGQGESGMFVAKGRAVARAVARGGGRGDVHLRCDRQVAGEACRVAGGEAPHPRLLPRAVGGARRNAVVGARGRRRVRTWA